VSLEKFVAWLEARRRRESLAAIGKDMGVTQTTITLWLQGKRRPSRMALRLAEVLERRHSVGELHGDALELHTKSGEARFLILVNQQFGLFRQDNFITIDVAGAANIRFTLGPLSGKGIISAN
jgi:hypothetical protein